MKKIIWTNRYSQTDEMDDLGRWARVGYLEHKSNNLLKRVEIAWIKKHEDIFLCYVYLGSGKFNKEINNIEDAKQYCEDAINDFYNDYLS
jgi:hypothetical protein